MPTLGTFIDVALGYKTLMNDFFYVNQSTIDVWSIEDQFLEPVFLLSDLNGGAYRQEPTGSVWLFHCKMEPGDLRGTGAGRYIDWAARQETGQKKQSGAPVSWEEALTKQGGKHWWWPKASLKPAKIAFRKAIDVYYAPFVFSEPAIVDQRLYTISPKLSLDEGLITAYLCSSLFPLSLEVNADMGLGAGALTLGTRSLAALPAPDLAAIPESADLASLRSITSKLLAGKPPSALNLGKSAELKKLDGELLRLLGLSHWEAEELESEVTRLAIIRKSLAAQRRSVQKATVDLDVNAVADTIYEKLSAWLSGRRFPEDFEPPTDLFHMSLPASALNVETSVLLGQCDIKILLASGSHDVVYSSTLDAASAEVLLRALQLGRRDFNVCQSHSPSSLTLDEFATFIEELQERLDTVILETGIGARWEGEVRRRVLDRAGLDLRELRRPFDSRGHWTVAAT